MNNTPSIAVDASQAGVVRWWHTIGSLLWRIGRTIFLTSLVVISLLTFPSSIPWMIAFWLAWHTVAVAWGKPAWVPLLACVAILLAKRTFWPPALIAFVCVAVIVATWRATGRAALTSRPRTKWLATLALWVAWVCVAYEWHAIATCGHAVQFSSSRPIVCLGDSLTSGLLPDRGYPAQLQTLVQPPVINLGQSGISTEDGLAQLARLSRVDPPAQVVIIELGGHDFLRGKTRAATKANLEEIINACRALDADVVLVEIPRAFMTDPFWGLERQIAYEQDVELVADSAIRQLVLWSPASPPGMWMPDSRLSDDGIHSNQRGSQYLAEHVAASLERMYGPRIRRGTLDE